FPPRGSHEYQNHCLEFFGFSRVRIRFACGWRGWIQTAGRCIPRSLDSLLGYSLESSWTVPLRASIQAAFTANFISAPAPVRPRFFSSSPSFDACSESSYLHDIWLRCVLLPGYPVTAGRG